MSTKSSGVVPKSRATRGQSQPTIASINRVDIFENYPLFIESERRKIRKKLNETPTKQLAWFQSKIQKVERHLQTIQQASPRPTRSGNISNPAEERLLQHFIFYTKHYEDIHKRLFPPTQRSPISLQRSLNALSNLHLSNDNPNENTATSTEAVYDSVHESTSNEPTLPVASIESHPRRPQNSIPGSPITSTNNQIHTLTATTTPITNRHLSRPEESPTYLSPRESTGIQQNTSEALPPTQITVIQDPIPPALPEPSLQGIITTTPSIATTTNTLQGQTPQGATALSPTTKTNNFRPSQLFTSSPRPHIHNTQRLHRSSERQFHGFIAPTQDNSKLSDPQPTRPTSNRSPSQSPIRVTPLNSTQTNDWDDNLGNVDNSPNLQLGNFFFNLSNINQSFAPTTLLIDHNLSLPPPPDDLLDIPLELVTNEEYPESDYLPPPAYISIDQEEEIPELITPPNTPNSNPNIETEDIVEDFEADSQAIEETYNLIEMEEIMRRLAQSHEQATQSLVDNLRDMGANTAKQQIPLFSGKLGEQTVHEWLDKADRIAIAEGWDEARKLRYYQQRLIKPASSFNDTILEATRNTDFLGWKTAFITGFADETTKNRWKHDLENLKQDPNERVRDFVSRINNLYLQVHGPGPANNQQADVTTLREDTKKKIFLNGVRRDIYSNIWSRVDPATTWNNVITTAEQVEAIIEKKHILEQRPEIDNAVATVIKENAKLTQDIAKISDQIEKLTVLSSKQVTENTVAAISDQQRPEGRPRVRFTNETSYRERSQSRESYKSPTRYQPARERTNNTQSTPAIRPRNNYPARQQERPASNTRGYPSENRYNYQQRPPSRQYYNQNQTQNPGKENIDPRNNEPPANSTRTIICYYCNKPGHIQRECRTRMYHMSNQMANRNSGYQQKPQTN